MKLSIPQSTNEMLPAITPATTPTGSALPLSFEGVAVIDLNADYKALSL